MLELYGVIALSKITKTALSCEFIGPVPFLTFLGWNFNSELIFEHILSSLIRHILEDQ